jgi:CRP-like cAMP-binding protein
MCAAIWAATRRVCLCCDNGHPVAVLLPGDVFGETAYLLEGKRTFDVDVLSDDTRLLALSERSLRALDPTVTSKLLTNISKILCHRRPTQNA